MSANVCRTVSVTCVVLLTVKVVFFGTVSSIWSFYILQLPLISNQILINFVPNFRSSVRVVAGFWLTTKLVLLPPTVRVNLNTPTFRPPTVPRRGVRVSWCTPPTRLRDAVHGSLWHRAGVRRYPGAWPLKYARPTSARATPDQGHNATHFVRVHGVWTRLCVTETCARSSRKDA